ncbi:N-acetylmuramoyl-L-alanine amidase [Nocardia sp. CDC153]|uniref:N-acetylmuramoyl-L-alanine amidase n=1 Tax=Nocardia sp. CDC153 TaxID=3112167 RepID=UPI002DBE934B|nr:N-acetylmuramoyl-L-alanine amidase [Nocardia sp. CDC153]MEC3957938.1 N-acetylmuramoyl-L-alanine amidase [Nocardia sp. CDC153]
MAEVALDSAPDITLPLRELTGLNLPDLHLSDLRMLPLPRSIPIPPNLIPGVQLPSEIPLPRLNPAQPDAKAPATTRPATPGATRPAVPGTGQPATPGIAGLATPTTTAPAAPAATPNAARPAAPGSARPTSPAAGTPGFVAEPGPDAGQPPAAPGNESPAPATDSGIPTQNAVAPDAQVPAADNAEAPGPHPVPGLEGDLRTPALSPGAVPNDLIDKVGAQVKELTRDTPFSMVALTAADLVGTTTKIRAQRPDGTWGPWYDAETENGKDHPVAGKRTGTEPIYVGNTKTVQMLVTRKPVSAPAEPKPLDDGSADPAQINLEKLAAVLIDPGRGSIDQNLSSVAAPLPGGGPKVITRAQWGADESLRCEEPTYDDGVSAITVHHTAGRNDYTKAESAGIVRAIYAYHAKTLGWCDIGYNALVDKYGQIFEGRYGGLDRPVEGAHAGGFNINTAGVALMGDYEDEAPTDVSIQAIGKYIGWRAKVAGIDPEGSTTMYSEGSDYTKYALGQAVKLPNIFAHRDVGNTTCPGDAAYALMDKIRQIAEDAAGGTNSIAPQSTTPRARPGQNAGNTQPPAPAPDANQSNQADLAALADLTQKILNMLDRSPVARYWDQQGGANGPLGQPKTEPIALADGGQYGQFTNGYVYSTPSGQIFSVVGKILERFLQLGAGAGILGLPSSNEYPVPDGVRADFQNGALIFNRLTGIVTTVLNNYGAVQDPVPGK